MASHSGDTPVHSSLEVQAREDIYQTDDWWKSAVRYRYEGSDATEVAVYLWHDDGDGWTRKHKYVVKTPKAWAEDSERIEQFLSGQFPPADEPFPTSDYYTLNGGETVFQSDDWWKAIVNVGMKGDYETDEVMIYLWQRSEGDWRRRQKSVIKSDEDWTDLSRAVESVMEQTNTPAGEQDQSDTLESVVDLEPDAPKPENSGGRAADHELSEVQREVEAHLSAMLE